MSVRNVGTQSAPYRPARRQLLVPPEPSLSRSAADPAAAPAADSAGPALSSPRVISPTAPGIVAARACPHLGVMSAHNGQSRDSPRAAAPTAAATLAKHDRHLLRRCY